MDLQDRRPRRIAVIGGGIAGLAAAHRIAELDPGCSLALFEAGPRLGGVVSTLHEDGYQVEQSADNFITTVPWGLALCRRIGLEDQLVQTNGSYRRTFVVLRGRMHPLPDGFLMMAPARLWPLALTGILSPLGKIRTALEYFIPPRRDQADESMANFVRRRLGREAFQRLVEPLVGAVYAADLEKLGVLATLPRFREMERQHGSLIRAMRRTMKDRRHAARESGARYSMFVTLRDGLASLVQRLASRLPAEAIHLNAAVTRIERSGNGWRLWDSNLPSPLSIDALIIAAPSPAAARLLRPTDPTLADRLDSIERSGSAVVSLGYDSRQIGHPLDGMGVVSPAIERSPVLACSFSSRKYPHRAPEGKELLRVFVGGARRPEFAEMDDGRLLTAVLGEISRLLRIRGGPCFCSVARWPASMPQYRVGHLELVAEIEARAAALPNLQLAGNSYRGVGIPDCIHGGELAAERTINCFATAMPRTEQ